MPYAVGAVLVAAAGILLLGGLEQQGVSVMDTLLGALKSKVIWFNLLGLVAIIVGSDQIKAFIAPEHLMMVQAVINIVLRFITSEALAVKA